MKNNKSAFPAIGWFLAGVFVATVLLGLDFYFRRGHSAQDVDITFVDLAAISLTAATVVLGAVAIIIGIAAFFSFQVLKERAVDAAEGRVDQYLADNLGEQVAEKIDKMAKDGRLAKELEKAIYATGPDSNGQDE